VGARARAEGSAGLFMKTDPDKAAQSGGRGLMPT
jgi:hypothetical protein